PTWSARAPGVSRALRARGGRPGGGGAPPARRDGGGGCGGWTWERAFRRGVRRRQNRLSADVAGHGEVQALDALPGRQVDQVVAGPGGADLLDGVTAVVLCHGQRGDVVTTRADAGQGELASGAAGRVALGGGGGRVE